MLLSNSIISQGDLVIILWIIQIQPEATSSSKEKGDFLYHLAVEPLFQASYFVFAYDNFCSRILCKDYLDFAIEPVGNPQNRRYVYYLLAGHPEKLHRVELRVNIIESHVDVILPFVFKIQVCQACFG